MNSQIDGCIRHVVSRNTPRYWWHRTSLASERERAKQRRRFDD